MYCLVFFVVIQLLGALSEEIKLVYFNGKGNAEVSRMMMHLADVEFEDIRAGKDFEWQAAKEAGLYGANLNRLPVLSWNGVEIGQTKPIERYLAKKYGFLGMEDIEGAQIEAVVEHVTDIRMVLREVKARREKGSDELNDAVAEFMTTEEDGGALHWVSRVEKYLEGHEGFAVGGALSLADLYLHQLCTYTLVDAQELILARNPKIANIVSNVNDVLTTKQFHERNDVHDEF